MLGSKISKLSCACPRPIKSPPAVAGSPPGRREKSQHQWHQMPDEHPNYSPNWLLCSTDTSKVPGTVLVTAMLKYSFYPQGAHSLMRDKYNKANNSLTMIVIMRVIVPRVVGTSDGNLNQVVILKVMDGTEPRKQSASRNGRTCWWFYTRKQQMEGQRITSSCLTFVNYFVSPRTHWCATLFCIGGFFFLFEKVSNLKVSCKYRTKNFPPKTLELVAKWYPVTPELSCVSYMQEARIFSC